MSWFRKSCSKNRGSRDNAQRKCDEKTANATSEQMAKSLRALEQQRIEVLDPDDFFEDPEHVRNYKEEAKFLQLMSEWVIVENPANLPDNFFSADFEDELLQMRTQPNSPDVRSNEHISAMPQIDTAELSAALNNEAQARLEQLLAQEQCKLQRSKRCLCERLFAHNIELGIALPQCAKRDRQKKRRKIKLDMREGVLEVTTADADDDADQAHYSSASSITGERYQTSSFQTNASTLPSSVAKSNSLTLVNACNNSVLKDCAINRKQLKTEALARSIMGAIGKCPAKDSTPDSSEFDLIAQSGDSCHPTGWSGCDHYDIKQYFHLDDEGNILLNINHIEEIKGFGFAVAHNKQLYRRCRKECQVLNENYKKRRYFCKLLKYLLRALCNFVNGELWVEDGMKEECYMDMLYDAWKMNFQLLTERARMHAAEREI